MKIDQFAQEEQDILDSYSRDEWHPVPNVEAEMQQYRAYAAGQAFLYAVDQLAARIGAAWQGEPNAADAVREQRREL
ncbi:MAG: hypothetical protein H0U76_19015 [Ktedonobacteraceae bacterium]|nr:hypothetical protein [Ktedonobacteraceae bacterium]